MNKRVFAAVIGILVALNVGAQERRLSALAGETVSILLEFDRPAPTNIELILPPLPPELTVTPVPVVVTRFGFLQEVRIEVSSRVPGRYVIPPIEVVIDGGEVQMVSETLLEVAPSRGAPVPFSARWRALSDPVYVGQSIPVLLEITKIDSFTFPDSVSFRAPPAGLFEEVSGFGSVSSNMVAGVDLFTIPVAAFIFTPTSTGEVSIPAAQVDARGMTVTAPALTITPRELPPQIARSGAVGSFTVYNELDLLELVSGETGELVIEISGAGNLPVLDPPEVTFQGLTLVDQSDSLTVSPDVTTLSGYRGVRERRVRFQAEENVDAGTVRIDSFSFLNSRTGAVETEPARTFRITVASDPGEGVAAASIPDLSLLTVEQLKRLRWFSLTELRWPWFLFLAGPVVFSVVTLLSVRGSRRRASGKAATLTALVFLVSASLFPVLNTVRLGRADELISEGRYDVAAVLYDLEIQDHQTHPGLHYNRGVLSLRAGNLVATRFHLRRAVRLDSRNEQFRTALARADGFIDDGETLPVPRYPQRNIFFLVFLGLWTLFWVLLLLRHSVARALSLLTIIMLGIGSGGAALWTWNLSSVREGVVRQEVTVRRIPDSSAEPWLQLDPGMPVIVDLSYDQFYLIRTTSGVTGWVPVRAIWYEGATP